MAPPSSSMPDAPNLCPSSYARLYSSDKLHWCKVISPGLPKTAKIRLAISTTYDPCENDPFEPPPLFNELASLPLWYSLSAKAIERVYSLRFGAFELRL